MACPIHDSSESRTSHAPQVPSDACIECRQQDSEQCPQCLNPGLDNTSEQHPGTVHWPTVDFAYEVTGYDAEDGSLEACRAFDNDSTSTNAPDLDTPDSSSDERSGIYCPSSRNSVSQFSDESTTSEDGSVTGASSGYASDAVCERFLACDGPWSTYNLRLEMPAHDQFSPAGCDDDDGHRNVASYAE